MVASREIQDMLGRCRRYKLELPLLLQIPSERFRVLANRGHYHPWEGWMEQRFAGYSLTRHAGSS